jgi:hypothetical protein
MSELELFLLMGVLTPKFNTMDLVKILAKISKTSHSDHSSHIEGDVMQKSGSYGVGIGRAWYSRKACEICSSLI